MMMMMSGQGTSKSTLIWQSDVHSCGRFRSFLVSNDEIGKKTANKLLKIFNKNLLNLLDSDLVRL